MCGPVSIARYRRSAWSSVEGEYVHPETGSEAITVKVGYDTLINVYNASGTDYHYYDRPGKARKAMAKRGFVPQQPPIQLEQPTDQPIQAPEPTKEAQDITEYLKEREAQGVVQGKTQAEWAEQGRINATLPREQRVHPAKIDGSEDELLALVNSMTEEEAVGTVLAVAELMEETKTALASAS